MPRDERGSDAEVARYLQRLGCALRPLPADEREEIVRETHAHLMDRLSAAPPQWALAETVREFGPPEEYARRFLDNYHLSAAVADGSGPVMLRHVLRMTGRGVGAAAGAALFLFLYVIAAALVLVALLKPVFPRNVGLWYAPGSGLAALGFVDAETAARAPELLGYWIIPINLVAGALLYRGASALLRRFLRSFLPRAGFAPEG